MFKRTNTMLLDKLFKEGIEVFSDVVSDWPGFEEYSPKLKEFSKNYHEKALKTYSPNTTNGYNVLNHGDFHNKNILVKKIDQRIEDFYFVSVYKIILRLNNKIEYFRSTSKSASMHPQQSTYYMHSITSFQQKIARLTAMNLSPITTKSSLMLCKHMDT